MKSDVIKLGNNFIYFKLMELGILGLLLSIVGPEAGNLMDYYTPFLELAFCQSFNKKSTPHTWKWR